jgi:homogentisate 1,2-dioxygenase
VDLPEGTYERELGREGFFGPSAQMYHRHPPTGWTEWEGPLRPRAFHLSKLEHPQRCPWQALTVLHNAHLQYRFWRTEGAMETLARNGDGDELLFVHQGRGDLFCDYGHLAIEAGDYVVLPRGTMWRTEFAGAAACLLIEATNAAYGLPDKGLLGGQALFDPAMLDTPRLDDAFRAQQTEQPWRLRIKRRNAISTVTYPYNPLDAVGWRGDQCPVRINVRDIRPVTSPRYHLPPSVHTTFVAERFVVCTFCPRPFETDPGALKVPYFHNNDDYDEATFYHAGDFFSRDNIQPATVCFHPSGFPHGPHPKALQNALTPPRPATDEYAVALDARDALEVAPLPPGVEDPDYVYSWRAKP